MTIRRGINPDMRIFLSSDLLLFVYIPLRYVRQYAFQIINFTLKEPKNTFDDNNNNNNTKK